MRAKLTDTAIRSYAPRPAQYAIGDASCPGLCVRVTPKGIKTFAFAYRNKGQTDKAITSTRRQLLEAVKMVTEGFNPKGADASYYDIRAVERVLPPGVNWLQALKDEMYPTGAPF